jgi:hypothetical protein
VMGRCVFGQTESGGVSVLEGEGGVSGTGRMRIPRIPYHFHV